MSNSKYVTLYDTTLRDGGQMQGVDYTHKDKNLITTWLDDFGMDYIEGGWPGANPTDDLFFEQAPSLKKSRLTAFGMTRRPSTSVGNDPGLAALVNTGLSSLCLVGKTWDFQVKEALNTTLSINLDMIGESVSFCKERAGEAIFDAEHFFDGYKANPSYALESVLQAYEAGARWVVLCDTNGGTLPAEIYRIVSQVSEKIPGSSLGIHCHNDTENAVANSLAALDAGARHVQGTLNGLGERCGNANLITLIPTLLLKTDYKLSIPEEKLKDLTRLAHQFDEYLTRTPLASQAYVGRSAFAHKAGLHASAVVKAPATYEHIVPETVGNERQIIMSNQAGRANLLSLLKSYNLSAQEDSLELKNLLAKVKTQNDLGISYDSADASFELLARSFLAPFSPYFKLERFRVIDERRWNAMGNLITESAAIVDLYSGAQELDGVGRGVGPVDSLYNALLSCLAPIYPSLKKMRLSDYKVRIINSAAATQATTRVTIECSDDEGRVWNTLGVSSNIIDASYSALEDAISWILLKTKS